MVSHITYYTFYIVLPFYINSLTIRQRGLDEPFSVSDEYSYSSSVSCDDVIRHWYKRTHSHVPSLTTITPHQHRL
jgi:hypothetical protein